MDTRAKRRWHLLKLWIRMRGFVVWRIGEVAKAEYAARFDAVRRPSAACWSEHATPIKQSR